MKILGKDIELKLTPTIFVFLFLAVSVCKAQENYDITYEDASFKFGIHAGPNGSGLVFRSAIPMQKQISRIIDISFTGIKHIKEKSVLNQKMVNTSPYIYGKVNRLYALRPMVGLQKMMAEKHSKNSVGINVFVLFGPTIGFLKPIYMDIETFDPSNPGVIVTSSVRYNPEIHKHENITGYSSFSKGIGKTKIQGGLSLKSGVEFNWGYYSSEFKSIEIGILVDYFPSRPELLHFVKNKIVYSSFYVSFAFGKNY